MNSIPKLKPAERNRLIKRLYNQRKDAIKQEGKYTVNYLIKVMAQVFGLSEVYVSDIVWAADLPAAEAEAPEENIKDLLSSEAFRLTYYGRKIDRNFI